MVTERGRDMENDTAPDTAWGTDGGREVEEADDPKVLRWAQLFQPLIPVLDVMLNCDYQLSPSGYGDGHDHGNGDGTDQYRSNVHRKGDGTGNALTHRSKNGNGSSLVMRDGSGTVIRQ